jgi:hypothetical protein
MEIVYFIGVFVLLAALIYGTLNYHYRDRANASGLWSWGRALFLEPNSPFGVFCVFSGERMRNRYKHTTTLEERLLKAAEDFRAKAKGRNYSLAKTGTRCLKRLGSSRTRFPRTNY